MVDFSPNDLFHHVQSADIVMAFYEECGLAYANSVSMFSQIKFTDNGETLRVGTKILLTLYGVFNLDFFHYVLPPFCISSKLRPTHVLFLGYISAFYPLEVGKPKVISSMSLLLSFSFPTAKFCIRLC